MYRFFASALIIASMVGCNEPSGPKAPPKLPVKGSVTLNGSPFEGEISFNTSGQVPTMFKVSGGNFTGEAFTGSNRAELFKFKDGPTDTTGQPTKINELAPKYTSGSTLTADVKEGAANNFKFEATIP
jgi:hypothetical protein